MIATGRRFLICGLAIAGGLLGGLVVAEGLLRALEAAPTDGVTTVTEKEFWSVPGILSPGQRVIDRRDPRLPHRVTTNSLGYRGREIAALKEPGELRILFTGDSFVYGDFVNDDQTLPAQLERRLNARCANVRVVNAGLGDATITEEAALIDRGLRLSPDLVILMFGENDVGDLNRVSTWDRLATNRRAKSQFPLGTFYPLLRRTALWNFALSIRATKQARARAGEPIGGTLMLTVTFVVCLDGCVRAFGGHLSYAAIAVVFLAGADFVTGTTLVVDGGRLLKSAGGGRP